jgi:hypothetical protein
MKKVQQMANIPTHSLPELEEHLISVTFVSKLRKMATIWASDVWPSSSSSYDVSFLDLVHSLYYGDKRLCLSLSVSKKGSWFAANLPWVIFHEFKIEIWLDLELWSHGRSTPNLLLFSETERLRHSLLSP